MISLRATAFLLFLIILFSCNQEGQENQSPSQEVLDRSIAFHDPQGEWNTWEGQMNLKETRPDGNVRTTTLWFNNNESYLKIRRGDQEFGMKQDSCFVISGDVDCERVEFMRNYFLYLWGLPMKLQDPGTSLSGRVDTLTWNSRDVLALHVSYEKEDWSYYFDRQTYALTGYQFVKKDGTGEWIELYDTEEAGNMLLPRERRWFVLGDSTYLGADILTGD